VIYKLRELRGIDELGGTMRLGAWTARLKPGSFAHQAYGTLEISERHRHRYEFNREYEESLLAHGMDLTGVTPDGTYVEIVEIHNHPWFLGCQFHPEFKSRPLEPHPLFTAFISAAYEYRLRRKGTTHATAQREPAQRLAASNAVAGRVTAAKEAGASNS
jgi:CTP synthase